MANVVLAIIGISLLMIVHEAGHYAVARACGMRVVAFSIGFGPALVKWTPKGSPTTFQIGLIPLLAYVRIAGSNPLEENDPDDPGLYQNKGVFARAATLFGGPFANYLVASIAVFVLAMVGLREQVPTAPMMVARVDVGSPAEIAGVRTGDEVVAIEGRPVRDVNAMREIVGPRAGMPTAFVFRRDGRELDPMTVVPRSSEGRAVIGVVPTTETHVRHFTAPQAAALAVTVPFSITVANLSGMADLVRHRTTQGVTGPVGMAKQVASEAEKGVYAFVTTLVALSVAIGCFNLLPLPFLDGGRLLFALVELVMGRRPNQNIETIIHATGMLLLLGVAALVTWRDLVG